MGLQPFDDLPTGDKNVAQRSKLFRSINRRNNIVAMLRWIVPGFGLVIVSFLIFQIILTNIAKDYGISGLRVEQDQVVIDKPRYGGLTQNGTRYNIEAEVARVQTSNTDIINLEQAIITIEQSDGYKMISTTAEARLDLTQQLIFAPGVLHTTDSDGVKGQFTDTIIDWDAQTLKARGPVDIEFSDGAMISAQSLFYHAETSSWDFSRMTYTLAGDGEN